jgi:hypothetical protein
MKNEAVNTRPAMTRSTAKKGYSVGGMGLPIAVTKSAMVRESSARDHRSATTRGAVERGAQEHQQQLGFVGDSSSSSVGSSDVQSMTLVRHTKGLTDEDNNRRILQQLQQHRERSRASCTKEMMKSFLCYVKKKKKQKHQLLSELLVLVG